jgi:protein FRG1
VTFRTSSGKFLGTDEFGVVFAEREARGVQEEWEIEDYLPTSGLTSTLDRWISIKSSYGRFLTIDEIAGGKLEFRADSDVKEGWKVWMQKEWKDKRLKELGGNEEGFGRKDGIKVIRGGLKAQEEENM